MIRSIVLAACGALGACAASGPRFAEHPASVPIAAEQGRIVVYRTGNHAQYSVRSARLQLDGVIIGGVRLAGFTAIDLSAARHTLAVDMWDAPGRCELSVDVQPGTTHYLEVAPRLASWLSGAPAVIAPPTPAGGLIGATLAISGMAVESGGKACGGAFAIAAVDQAAALAKLASLRESR